MGIIMSESKAFRADLARSVRLFRAFRTEQTAPEAYYTALARDTVHQLSQYAELDGRIVIDVDAERPGPHPVQFPDEEPRTAADVDDDPPVKLRVLPEAVDGVPGARGSVSTRG